MTTATQTEKRITLSTIKSFIRRNEGKLMIRSVSAFDSMCDGVRFSEGDSFSPVIASDRCGSNNLGIQGAWFVLGSRDYFSSMETETHIGYHVYNCCGSFDLAIAK